MIEIIATFYIFLWVALVALRLMKPNFITYIAFTWFGPFPEEGELLSSFKVRRIGYALGWIIQFSVYFALLILLGNYFKEYFFEKYFIVGFFVGSIAMGMAGLAFLGFVISWLKTITIGPNPRCEYIKEHE